MNSRNIQRLDSGISAVQRSETEVFLASGTVTAGDWVSFDISKTGTDKVLYVKKCVKVALGAPLVCGVALETVVSGAAVKVCIAGYVAKATVDAGTAAGDLLVIVTADGVGDPAATGDISFCGIALTAAAAGSSECIVLPRF
jgi:hypothetical protein